MRIGVVGATGNVGRKVIAMLLERFDKIDLELFASSRSAGQDLNVSGQNFIIQDANKTDFNGLDIVIFNTEHDVSQALIPVALSAGAYIVDSSSHYRLDPDVPLIIPPVNSHLVCKDYKLYAHANCLASPISTAVGPIHKKMPIKRLNAVTYQSVSGAGKAAADECWTETKSLVNDSKYTRNHFERQIAFNVIPQVGSIREDGLTGEEYKIIHEIKKVVDSNIAITATAVRVPVLIGHSIALSLEFYDSIELSELKELLKKAPSVQLSPDNYHTPVEVVDTDDVFVGRIRQDTSVSNGVHMWLVSDNLRRGAATDAVEIVESLQLALKS